MKNLLILMIICSLATKSFAQEKEPSKNQSSGSLYLTIFFSPQQFQHLDEKLAARALPAVKPKPWLFGLGGYGEVNRFVFGGEGGSFGFSSENDSFISRMNDGYGYFYLGYKIRSSERFMLSPAIGFGGGGASLSIARKRDISDFDTYLEKGTVSRNIGMGGFLFHASIGGEIYSANNSGHMLGFRLGYNYMPPKSWSGSELSGSMQNTPADRFGGFFLEVRYGMKVRSKS